MQQEMLAQMLYMASLIGGLAFALSGFLIGVRRQFDAMGVFILAFLTANGGGVIRDLLVGQPVGILQSVEPFWLTASVIVGAWLLKIHLLATPEKRWFFVLCDAIGLVAFGITGALVAIEHQVHFFGFITLSFLTATGGGILRDLLTNHVPEVLHSGFYGSVAILVGISLYGLNATALLSPLTLGIVFAAALSIRIIAHKNQWKLPRLG